MFHSINDEFMLCLEVATPVFQETAVASAALQHKDVALAVLYTLVEGVLKRLQELRTESEFKVTFEKAKEWAKAAESEFPDKIPGESRPRKIPTRYSTVPSQQKKTITLRIWRSSTEQDCTTHFWIPLFKRCSDNSKERIIVHLALSSKAYTV